MDSQSLSAEANHVALAEQASPGEIERVEQDDGTVRYRNVMLLAPGVWGDAASQRQFLYSEDTTATLADNIADTTLNLFHEQENETTTVGDLDESSVYVGDDDGGLYGDLVLSMENAASEFADEALQDALQSRGEKGIKGPSVEIARPSHQFNAEAGVPEVTDGVITGVGLVGLGVSLGPGSKDVAFSEQTRDRAVALADAGGATVLTKDESMSTSKQLLGELAEQLSDDELREVAEEHGIELQTDSEMGMVAELVEQAATEGFDPSDQSVDELRSFIQENLDPSEDAMAAFDSVAESVTDAMDADDEDSVSAADMAGWIEEQMDADDGESEESEGDDGDEPPEPNEADEMGSDGEKDEEMEMADKVASIQEQVQANAERIEQLATATETLQEGDIDLAEMAESLSDLTERVDTVASNLKEPTSLAESGGPGAFDADAEDDEYTFVDFGSNQAVNKEY